MKIRRTDNFWKQWTRNNPIDLPFDEWVSVKDVVDEIKGIYIEMRQERNISALMSSETNRLYLLLKELGWDYHEEVKKMPKKGDTVHFRGDDVVVYAVMFPYVKMKGTGGCWFTYSVKEGFKISPEKELK